MKNHGAKRGSTGLSGRKLGEEFRTLSHRMLKYANRGLPRVDFAREVSRMLIDFSGCDALELRLKRSDKYYRCEAKRGAEPWFWYEQLKCSLAPDGRTIPCSEQETGIFLSSPRTAASGRAIPRMRESTVCPEKAVRNLKKLVWRKTLARWPCFPCRSTPTA
jgi:hypothetical protein